MALDVLTLPGRLAVGPSADASPRVNIAQFGDGYSQRAEDGLNADNQTFTGQCPSLTPAKAESLLAFFRAHTSVPFLWNLPLDESKRKWIATKWTQSFVATNRRAVSFALTEVFDL